MLSGDGVNIQNRDSGDGDGDDECLGQSPPSSPRTSQSPLMFRPQLFVFLLHLLEDIFSISSPIEKNDSINKNKLTRFSQYNMDICLKCFWQIGVLVSHCINLCDPPGASGGVQAIMIGSVNSKAIEMLSIMKDADNRYNPK